ncbi:endonuclease-reverse transcriptase, partial [Plakobranchus ocellatus]
MIGQHKGHKGGRISQGQNGDPSRGDFPATQTLFSRRTPSHEVPKSKPPGRCGADRAYAPTREYDDADVEIFYEELENVMDPKCKYKVIIGDFNSKIGVKEADEGNEWIGPFGIGEKNERGERLIDFCVANKLYITNSFYQKPTSRYRTWESPGGRYKNQTDFILTTDKSMAQNTEIITKVDIGSDHRMVRSRICINKKLERLKRIKRKKPPRIDVRQLEKVAPIFPLELQNRFEVLANETPSIEILNKSITKTAADVSEKRIETEEEVNTEDK